VVLYLAVYIAAYVDALGKRGTFLGDIWLDVLALPYIAIVGRVLLGDPTFDLHVYQPWGLLPAVLFCSFLLLALGAGIEWSVRRLLRRGRTPSEPSS